MPDRSTTVQIETLALQGVGLARDEARLGRLVEAALERLIARRGLLPGLVGTPLREVVIPSTDLAEHRGPETVAEAVALALYRALGGES
jgi:hypothetical protein